MAFSLLAVPLLPRLGAIRVSAYSALTAVPLLLVAGVIVDGRGVLPVPSGTETAALAYLAVVVTAIAFFCWYDALPRLGAERAGLFSGFLPIGAAASSLLLGTGRVGPGDVAGIVVVLTGLTVGFLAPARRGSASAGEAHPRQDQDVQEAAHDAS